MKKLGIICMILLFSMCAAGMGYAGWLDVISTRYEVATGTVSAGIRGYGADDYRPESRIHGYTGYTRWEDGPYQYELEGKSYADNVRVDIYGYQSYASILTLEMANCGSIPVKADQIMIDWHGDLADSIRVGKWSVDCPGRYQKKGQGFNSLGDAIRYTCLDPGQTMWLDLEFLVDGKKSQEGACRAVSNALSAFLKTKTATAAESDDISPGDDKTNATDEATNLTEPPAAAPDGPADKGQAAGEAPASVYTLPEEPLSKATVIPLGTRVDPEPEMVSGTATGTITITYRRWNEQWW